MHSLKENEQQIQIGLMGDVMIGRLVNEQLNSVPPKYVWGDLLPILKNNDLNVINLEAALTTSTQIVPKTFNFKAEPKKIQSLVEGSIHVVNLANNHVLDYSEEGLLETLKILDSTGIHHVGAGKNLTDASMPVIKSIKGIKVGILGCTDNEPTWLATDHKPGIKYLHVGNLKAIQNDIVALRSKVDILILSIHWGPNMQERPSQNFIKFAHDLIHCGVDIIHGHSAHIFQGVEIYEGKVIFYDTGDFVDDYYVDPTLRNDRSFLFLVNCNAKGIVSLRFIPVLIENFHVKRASEHEANKSIAHMQQLSKEFGTNFQKENNELILRLSRE